MHEMALAEGILGVVLDAAAGRKVRRIRLQVGKLQMVVPDSLEFSFQLISADTPAAEAVLEMEETPATLRCNHCGAENVFDQPPFTCPACSGFDLEVISGDQLLVESVELENGDVIRERSVPTDEALEEHLKEHRKHASEHEQP